MKTINVKEELPKLNDTVWRPGSKNHVIEEKRESDYVLVYYKELWHPALLQLIKFAHLPEHSYNWLILGVGSFYTEFDKIEYWMAMPEPPVDKLS